MSSSLISITSRLPNHRIVFLTEVSILDTLSKLPKRLLSWQIAEAISILGTCQSVISSTNSGTIVSYNDLTIKMWIPFLGHLSNYINIAIIISNQNTDIKNPIKLETNLSSNEPSFFNNEFLHKYYRNVKSNFITGKKPIENHHPHIKSEWAGLFPVK